MISVKKNLFRSLLIFSTYIFSFPALSNLRGTDIQNFNPTSNGLDFVTVHSARTLKPYELNLGGFLNYTTNSLSYSTLSYTSNSQKFGDPNDTLLYSNFHFGVGILPGWEVGLNIGSTNSQQIKGESNFIFYYDVKGFNDIGLHSKIHFFEKKDLRLAVVGGIDFERIKKNPFSGSESGPTFNLEAVGDFRLNPETLFAVNFGYRIRQEGNIISNSGVVPISDQLVYSSAVSYTTDDKGSAVIGEIYGGFPVEETSLSTDREPSSLELLAGYRFSGIKNLHFHGGLGTGLYKGLGSPDFRIYFGLNWRTDQIGKALGVKKTETPIQAPLVPQKEETDSTTSSILKEVEGELPREIDTREETNTNSKKSLEKNSSEKNQRSDDILEINPEDNDFSGEDY